MSSQIDFPQHQDWAGQVVPFILAWGLPITLLVGAIFVAPPLKTMIWFVALLWMGGACLANALRCGRLHCYLTGPFFLIMAVVALLHGFEIVWLGEQGWKWLGLAVGVGGGVLWCLPEALWGKFVKHRS